MAKPKLHELIAVEGELQGTAKKILEETSTTFEKKHEHFNGLLREVKMLSDSPDAKVQEVREEVVVTTTVHAKLDYMTQSVVRFWDAVLQREATNQLARADLIVDGKVLATGVPGTFLLGMEDRLKALRAVYEKIPTLAPGKTWDLDKGQPLKGIYKRADAETRIRTAKVTTPIVLYEATAHHPAQVKESVSDVVVGTITQENWSGMISAADKSDLLGRIDTLIRAVKKARQRANTTEVQRVVIGKALMNYVNSGDISGAASAENEGPETA